MITRAPFMAAVARGLVLCWPLVGQGVAAAQNQSIVRRSVMVPPEVRQVILYVEIGWGRLSVNAGSAGAVVVEAEDMGILQRGGDPVAAADTTLSRDSLISIARRGDTVAVVRRGAPESRRMVGLRITAPPRTTLVLRMTQGGNIDAEGFSGAHDVISASGNVTLTGMRGSAIVDSRSGSIVASFAQVDGRAPLSFATANGSVELTVPRSTQASVRARAFGGTVISEFALQTVQRGPVGPRSASGPINGGGPPLIATTLNGSVRLIIGR